MHSLRGYNRRSSLRRSVTSPPRYFSSNSLTNRQSIFPAPDPMDLSPTRFDLTPSSDDVQVEFEKVPRKTINTMILDYLVKQGFDEAAKAFVAESGMCERFEIDSKANQRVKIRDLIREGKVDDAIQMVNEYYPTFLEDNVEIAVDLLHLKLVELIRAKENDKALEFAQDILSKHLEKVEDIGNRCEKTMALLIYEKPELSPFRDILDLDLRKTVAASVSDALLLDSEPGRQPQNALTSLMKKIVFLQDELDKANAVHLKVVDFATASLKMSNKLDSSKDSATSIYKKDD